MSLLEILTDSERRNFGHPPSFAKEERTRQFRLSPEMQEVVARIRGHTNRAGFVLQLGYFQASGRFFPVEGFSRKDIKFVERLLRLRDADLRNYSDRVSRAHREQICQKLNWKRVGANERESLVAEAQSHVRNQEYPRVVFGALLRLCWRRQWVIPSYSELATIIGDTFNDAEAGALETLQAVLDDDDRARLDALLHPNAADEDSGTAAPLTALKRIDQSISAKAIQATVEALAIFRNHYFSFANIYSSLTLTDRATDYYANWLAKASRQQLAQFVDPNKVYLHLLSFIKFQYFRRQDHGVDVILKTVRNIQAQFARVQREELATQAKARDAAIEALRKAQLTDSQFAQGVIAITKSRDAPPEEKYYKIERLAEDYLQSLESDTSDRKFEEIDRDLRRRRNNTSYYEFLERQSLKLQRRLSAVLQALVFDGRSPDKSVLLAIDHFKATKGAIGKEPPDGFLSDRDLDAVLTGSGVKIGLYKTLLFVRVVNSIKSGELNLVHSFRYRAIQDYLIPEREWRRNRDRLLSDSGLDRYCDAGAVLQELKSNIEERFRTTNARLLVGTNQHAWIGSDGRIRIRTPATEYESGSFISSTLSERGIVPILDVLKAADGFCEFTRSMTHFSTKRVKLNARPEVMMAGIIGRGCNIGLGKLARISRGIDIDSLRYTVNWCFSPDSLQKANRVVTEAIRGLALADAFRGSPTAVHSSSDGRKVAVAAESIHSAYSYKYFGQGQGVTDYSFVDEQQSFFHSRVFTASDRDAPYVLDGLVDNTGPATRIHSTDTHGFTEQIFGVSHLLGVTFAPRLAKPHRLLLYGFSTRRTHEKLGYVLKASRTINKRLIVENWDDILRFVATIRLHRSTASQLFKRLSSYAKDHPLYRAIKEFGRIIKTQFLLSYFDDVLLRQRIQKQLNLAEQGQKFARAVFFDNDQAFRYGTLERQQAASDCRILLQNCIVLWNYLALSELLMSTRDPTARRDALRSIQSGSVVTWSHINLRGEYTFTPPSANDSWFDTERIRSLRL